MRTFVRSFRKAFPAPASDRASAPSERTSHLTVPFLRRGIAPRSSVPARKFRASRVPLYVNILFSIKSYTIKQLYTFILFCQAVNGIMAKTEAGGLFRCFCNKKSTCFRKCFGEPSGIRTPGTLIKSLEKCMLYSYLLIFPLSKLRITIVFLSPVCNITVIYIWLAKSYFQHKC